MPVNVSIFIHDQLGFSAAGIAIVPQASSTVVVFDESIGIGTMTTNVVQGLTAEFIAEFRDLTGEPSIPSGAAVTLTYPSGTSLIVQTLPMVQLQPYRFVATWYSAVSNLGLVPWSISVSSVSSGPQIQGTIRVIAP